MKLLTGKTAIMAGIVAVAASGKKWESDVQVLAMSTMTHSVKHREVSLMNALVEALPKGARTKALVGYFDKFGPATYDVNEDSPTYKKFVFDKDKKADLAKAAETTWSTFKKETPYQPIDVCHLLGLLVARVEKDKKTDYDPNLVDGIKKLVKTHATVDAA